MSASDPNNWPGEGESSILRPPAPPPLPETNINGPQAGRVDLFQQLPPTHGGPGSYDPLAPEPPRPPPLEPPGGTVPPRPPAGPDVVDLVTPRPPTHGGPGSYDPTAPEPSSGGRGGQALIAIAIVDGVAGDVNQALGDPMGIGNTTPAGAAIGLVFEPAVSVPLLSDVGQELRDTLGHTVGNLWYLTPFGVIDAIGTVAGTGMHNTAEAAGVFDVAESVGTWIGNNFGDAIF